MIIPNTTDQIIDQLARDYNDQNRSAMLEMYQRNYRELTGDVLTRADDLARYWPRRYKETPEAYKERVKIWTQLPRIVCDKITSVALGGETERTWVADIDSAKEQADRANELDALCNEKNDWHAKASHIYFYSLGIGEMALWPEFRAFDKFTGQPYDVAGGRGVPIWSYWFPWFVEPISLQEYAEEIIGAAKLIWLDGQMATPLLTQTIAGGKQSSLTQVYLSPQYDHMTGVKTNKGFYRTWENNSPHIPNGLEKWWDENLYECNPVVFVKSPDHDETQCRGKSYVDRFRDLAINHSQTVSNIGQAIEVLPNIWKYTGEQKDIKNITIRSNEIVQIPENGTFEQAGRALDLSEDWKLVNYLEKTIALLAAIPAEVWDTLGSAGKVESGVALKLTMQPLVEGIDATRKAFAVAEKEKMRVTVNMFNAHNPNRKIDLKNIRPTVNYKGKVIPVDEAVQIVSDLSLFDKGVKSLTELVRKYHDEITTDEQAENWIKDNQESIAARTPRQPRSLFTRTNANA